jgi:hypothetical protein
MLDLKSFGTVSFEELLGHCNELFKKNQNDLIQLEDRLKSYGYIPGNFQKIQILLPLIFASNFLFSLG